MRHRHLFGLCAWTIVGALCASLPSAQADTSRPGFVGSLYDLKSKAVTWHWATWRDNAGDVNWAGVENDARLMQQAGIDWARVGLSPDSTPGDMDRLLAIARKYAIDFDVDVVKQSPSLTIGTLEQEAAQQAWLADNVDRYKSRVHVWEIGNEENLQQYWDQKRPDGTVDTEAAVARYIQYLSASYHTIKRHDPGATVLMGALSEANIGPWLAAFIAQGGGAYTDGFAVHPYARDPAAVVNRLRQILAVADKDPLLAGKPVWITEIGFHTESAWHNNPGYVPTEAVKAQYLTDLMQGLRAAGISTPIFWYCLHEAGPETNGYGLVVVDSRQTGAITTLPAYEAERQLWSGAPSPSGAAIGTSADE